MPRKSNNLLSLFSLSAIQKKLKFLFKPNNMQKVIILLGILLVLYLLHTHVLSKEGFDVTHENIDENISSKKTAVIFHADWCGHCKKFMPVWDEVSAEVNGKSEDIQLAKMDCSKSADDDNIQAVMKKYNVQGFPTVKLFENGEEVKEFDGERSSAGLKSFLGLA